MHTNVDIIIQNVIKHCICCGIFAALNLEKMFMKLKVLENDY